MLKIDPLLEIFRLLIEIDEDDEKTAATLSVSQAGSVTTVKTGKQKTRRQLDSTQRRDNVRIEEVGP